MAAFYQARDSGRLFNLSFNLCGRSIFDFDTAILGITRLGFVAAAVFAGHCFVHYTIKKQIHRLSELLFEKFKKQLL